MAPKILQSAFFKNKGSLTEERLKQLTANSFVRAEALIASQADGKVAAAVCMNIDETGVKSSFFALTGQLNLGLQIKASQLWDINDDTLKLRFTIKDASDFKFERVTVGTRNFSNWMDGLDKFAPRFFRGNEELDFTETVTSYPELDTGFSLRAYLVTGSSVAKLKLGVQAIPYSGQDLATLVQNGKQVFTFACPQVKVLV